MKRFFNIAVIVATVLQITACKTPTEEVIPSNNRHALTIDMEVSRVSFGEWHNDGRVSLVWSEGDCIAANGQTSSVANIDANNANIATFWFNEKVSFPANILYPASFYKSATTITLPSVQPLSTAGIGTNTLPIVAYIANEGDTPVLKHLAGVIHLRIKASSGEKQDLHPISKVEFIGGNSEQVCGDFTIDYENATLTPTSTKNMKVTVQMDGPLSPTEATNVYIVVPAREYSKGYTIRITDKNGHYMTKKKESAQTVKNGSIVSMPEFVFESMGFSLDVGV